MKFNFSTVGQPFEADWPIKVQVPQDGGKVQEQTFHARFRMGSDEQLLKLGATIQDTKDVLREVFVGFGAGTEETFTTELREQLLATYWTRVALNNAYLRFAQGVAEKN